MDGDQNDDVSGGEYVLVNTDCDGVKLVFRPGQSHFLAILDGRGNVRFKRRIWLSAEDKDFLKGIGVKWE